MRQAEYSIRRMEIDYSPEVVTIDMKDVRRHPNLEARFVPDDEQKAFQASISAIGVTEAVIVRRIPGSKVKYELLNGLRRYSANKKARHPTIRAKIVESRLDDASRRYIMYGVNNHGKPMDDDSTIRAIIREYGKERILQEFRGKKNPEAEQEIPLSELIHVEFGRSQRQAQRYLVACRSALTQVRATTKQVRFNDLTGKEWKEVRTVLGQLDSLKKQVDKLRKQRTQLVQSLKPVGGLENALLIQAQFQKRAGKKK